MRAQAGDRVRVEARHVGTMAREGEILEILRGHDSERFRVRWDSGEESVLYPQSDCRIIHAERPLLDVGPPVTPGSRTIEVHPDNGTRGQDHGFEMWLSEDASHTEARVTIQLREVEMTGFGVARRNPHDPQVPQVGEEVAMARALSDLAQQLFRLASYQIQRREGHPVHIDS